MVPESSQNRPRMVSTIGATRAACLHVANHDTAVAGDLVEIAFDTQYLCRIVTNPVFDVVVVAYCGGNLSEISLRVAA